ncbi:MAG: hypothetical protein SV775_05705 [Thermodesulfobacteriota bacterium]|nr:hypothetical protein [Thermodesulfobacteriota bacterium]
MERTRAGYRSTTCGFAEGRHLIEKGNDIEDRSNSLKNELDEVDKAHITDVFLEEVVTRLERMHARIGTLNCDFAGKQFKNWIIHFKSTRSGFDIVEFEYDEESRSFSLGP